MVYVKTDRYGNGLSISNVLRVLNRGLLPGCSINDFYLLRLSAFLTPDILSGLSQGSGFARLALPVLVGFWMAGSLNLLFGLLSGGVQKATL